MSSHHIIREKQEPALLILSLNNFDLENLGQLLEWSPTVLVSEVLYDHVYSLGIKIDGVISNSTSELNIQEHTKVIANEENNFLLSALNFFVKEGYPSVNIINNDFNLDDYTKYVSLIDLVIFSNDNKIFPIKANFSKWKPKNECIHTLTNAPIEVTGLTKLEPNKYQTIKDGFYSITFNQDFIFIAESL